MKKALQLYVFITLLALAFSSCGGKTNEKSNNLETEEAEQTFETEDQFVFYSFDGDCDPFIKAINFSTLCFTEKQLPEYKDDMTAKGRCQFQFSNGEIRIVIIHKDYTNYDLEKIEMDQLLSKGAFQKTGKRLYAKTKKIDNLGDDAYIGYEAIGGGNVTKLAILLNNVSVSVDVDNTSCSSSADELIKLGELIIEQIKK